MENPEYSLSLEDKIPLKPQGEWDNVARQVETLKRSVLKLAFEGK